MVKDGRLAKWRGEVRVHWIRRFANSGADYQGEIIAHPSPFFIRFRRGARQDAGRYRINELIVIESVNSRRSRTIGHRRRPLLITRPPHPSIQDRNTEQDKSDEGLRSQSAKTNVKKHAVIVMEK